MKGFLNYRYRIDLREDQQEMFDELYRCYVRVVNHQITKKSLSEIGRTDVDLKAEIQNVEQERCYIRKNFSPLLQYLRHTIHRYEKNARLSMIPKYKNPYSVVASLSFYPKDVNLGFRRTSTKMAEVNLLPFGTFPLYYHRPFPKNSNCVLMTLKRDIDRRYYFDFLLNHAYSTLLPENNIGINDILGIDFSVKHFFVSTDDTIVPNMNRILPSKKNKNLISKRRKNYARSEENSKNQERKRLLYVKSVHKMKLRRKQYFYMLAHQIFNRYNAVAVETLELRKMKEKRNYAKMITNECFYEFENVLKEVALKEGKRVIKIPKWYPSSKMCYHCGAEKKDLKVYEKEWICPNCGKRIIRDKNAAFNIRKKAFEMLEKEE